MIYEVEDKEDVVWDLGFRFRGLETVVVLSTLSHGNFTTIYNTLPRIFHGNSKRRKSLVNLRGLRDDL